MKFSLIIDVRGTDQAAAVRGLRRWLKYGLRVIGIRCLSIVPAKEGT